MYIHRLHIVHISSLLRNSDMPHSYAQNLHMPLKKAVRVTSSVSNPGYVSLISMQECCHRTLTSVAGNICVGIGWTDINADLCMHGSEVLWLFYSPW